MQISTSKTERGKDAPAGLEAWIKARALREGFDAAGIASPDATGEAGPEHVQITPSGKTPPGAGFDDTAMLRELGALRRDLPKDLARALVHALQTG